MTMEGSGPSAESRAQARRSWVPDVGVVEDGEREEVVGVGKG